MKRLLLTSVLINLLLLGAITWAVQKLGGFGYTWHRLSHREWGVYGHRVQHFSKLPERSGSIVFLGDSQLEQAEWHEVFGDSPPVLNRGISGEYTAGVLERLPEILRHKPLKIFLLVGVNDLFFGKTIAEVETDYRAIVQRIRSESSETELYLLSLFPVNNAVRDIGMQNTSIQALNTRIRQIAQDFALQYIDLYTPLTDADGNLAAKFTDDGLHINGLGYVVLKNELSLLMMSYE
jgi:lysophospholipase L1-like esterase